MRLRKKLGVRVTSSPPIFHGVFVYRLVREIVDLLGAVRLRHTPPSQEFGIVVVPGTPNPMTLVRFGELLPFFLGNSTMVSAGGSDPSYMCSIHISPAISKGEFPILA